MTINDYRQALYDFDLDTVRDVLAKTFAPDAKIHLAHPFETLENHTAYFETALKPLAEALPDLERRETIFLQGKDAGGETWTGSCGYYTGTFRAPFLGLLPTGHQVVMRFHEFFRLDGGQVTEMQALWDLPELMMQAGLWPMGPALGREWHVPGPATQDGLRADGDGSEALRIVGDMLDHLSKFAEGGLEAMALSNFWHPKCNWYGPSGIGTGRGIEGFRNWHQIPFLNALPNRTGGKVGHLFAEGDYVAYTAWPGMAATVTGDGWLGIAPSGQKITMRSLDFWRVENGFIRENWVLVDLLDIWNQLDVDVFARARELAKARTGQLDP